MIKEHPFFLFLASIPETFYSDRFYASYVKNGRGLGLAFLLIVAFLSTAQILIQTAPAYQAFLSEKDAFFESLPPLTLQNGELSTEAQTPIEATLFEKVEGGPLNVLFDFAQDSSNVARITKEMDDKNILALVTKDKLFIYDKNQGKAEITPFAKLKDTTITREEWVQTGNMMASITPFSVLIFGIFIFFISHTITAFIGALLLLVTSPLFKIDPSLKGCMRLAAAAKIPGAFLLLFGTPAPALLLVLWSGYSVFGLLSVRKMGKISTNRP